jgi:putative radical SAM enzyme (TIGR03279 family)
MAAIIEQVERSSIAEDLGLTSGDEVVSINGVVLKDYFDYKFYAIQEEIDLHIRYKSGEEEIFEIEKDFGEDLGITFDNVIFDKIRPCANNCAFCFIDQQPESMRETLLIKDDDYRLSFFNGTYITFTNLTKADKERIEQLRIGPLYVSVHTTDGELRSQILHNKRAKEIMQNLKWLEDLEIPIHTQIVLCPELNDGKHLDKTLSDLSGFSNVLSVAIVPVGITKFQTNPVIKKVTPQIAEEVITLAEKYNQKLGENLITPSDEFYILASKPIPDAQFYSEYGQLEDGVGTCRMLIDDFEKKKHLLPKKIKTPTEFVSFTGRLAKDVMEQIWAEFNKIENLKVDLHIAKSNFWGDDVSVAGLFTGQDILDELLPKKDSILNIIIPSVMLKDGSDMFLDNMTVSELEEKLGAKFHVIQDCYSVDELIALVKNLA